MKTMMTAMTRKTNCHFDRCCCPHCCCCSCSVSRCSVLPFRTVFVLPIADVVIVVDACVAVVGYFAEVERLRRAKEGFLPAVDVRATVIGRFRPASSIDSSPDWRASFAMATLMF